MKYALSFIILVVLAVFGWFVFPFENEQTVAHSFDECVVQGNAILEATSASEKERGTLGTLYSSDAEASSAYPPQCIDGAGNHFTQNIGNELQVEDRIRIDAPRPNAMIASPLAISGEARGYWFFEASFPVVLTDWDGRIIAEGHATAGDDWMVEDFVPFTAELTFEKPEDIGDFSKRGTLILKRDNPSGLPENDAALEIPIVFE